MSTRNGSQDGRSGAGRRLALAMLGVLAACAGPSPEGPASEGARPPVEDIARRPAPAPSAAPAAVAPLALIARENALWQPAAWVDLPGWAGDSALRAWPALLASCATPAPGWSAACASAGRSPRRTRAGCAPGWSRRCSPTASAASTAARRAWPPATTSRWCRHPRPARARTVALYRAAGRPGQRKPWYTRQEIDTLPEARQALARTRDRLGGRPARRAAAADPGLGPAAHHRARRQRSGWCGSPLPPPTTSPTAASAAGWCEQGADPERPRGPASGPGPRRTRSA